MFDGASAIHGIDFSGISDNIHSMDRMVCFCKNTSPLDLNPIRHNTLNTEDTDDDT